MNCPTCEHQYTPGDAFCDNCGAQLPDIAESLPKPPQEQDLSQSEKTLESFENQQQPSPQPVQPSQQDVGVLTTVTGSLVVQGTDAIITLPPGQTEIIIGRNDPIINHTVDVDLEPYGGIDHGVSRNHARIFVQDNKLFVEILSPTNLSYLNKRRLDLNDPNLLNHGDLLRLGSMDLVYHAG